MARYRTFEELPESFVETNDWMWAAREQADKAKEDYLEAILALDEGYSLMQIAEIAPVSYQVLRTWVAKAQAGREDEAS